MMFLFLMGIWMLVGLSITAPYGGSHTTSGVTGPSMNHLAAFYTLADGMHLADVVACPCGSRQRARCAGHVSSGGYSGDPTRSR